jgi:hypothetical protein
VTDEHRCTAPGCTVRGEHTSDCRDTKQCRGCKPAPAEDGCFCTADASKLRRWLGEIPDLFADVIDPPDASNTRVERDDIRDPIALGLPAGSVPGASSQPRVSGSPEDMLAARYVEAAGGTIHPTGLAVDQVGDPPPAVLLDSWCRDWQLVRGMGETLPAPAVVLLCGWLSDRLGWALEHHGAMPEFYAEIQSVHARLWREAGRGEARPELCRGVPCRRCDLLSLWRSVDGSGDVECHNPDCRTMYRADEYHRWVAMVAASTRRVEVDSIAETA